MTTHEVDDVDHWLTSTKRAEVFAEVAENIQTYVRPDTPNSVGLTMDVADMAAFSRRTGNEIIEQSEGAGEYTFLFRKG